MAYEIHVKELSRVLGAGSPGFTAAIVRLSVLFEDLRIEEAASRAEALPELDVIGANYRKLYFVRRGVATLVEVGGALKMVDEHPEFEPVFGQFGQEGKRRWRAAAEFFSARKEFIARLRADFGGHFDHGSALHALQDLDPETRGVLEIVKTDAEGLAGVRLKYAVELVAAAMARRKPADQPPDEYFREMFSVVRDGFRHAVEAMHTLSAAYVLPRFGRPAS
jgi:hypothetical protein